MSPFTQVAAPQPSGPVDLDAVERTLAQFSPGTWTATHVPALVAELRAAREAIEAIRDDDHRPPHPDCVSCMAIQAYDRAVGS